MNQTHPLTRRIPLALAALLAAGLIAFAASNAPFALAGKTVRAGVGGDNVFSPKTVTISRGGKVTWKFNGVHNVVGRGWSSPIKGGGTWSHKFRKKGRFNYSCSLHLPGMRGTVIVR